MPQRRRPAALLFAGLAVVTLALGKLPLLTVLLILTPSIAAAALFPALVNETAFGDRRAGRAACIATLDQLWGLPTVLPNVRSFVVLTPSWMTDEDFTNTFAMAQAISPVPT